MVATAQALASSVDGLSPEVRSAVLRIASGRGCWLPAWRAFPSGMPEPTAEFKEWLDVWKLPGNSGMRVTLTPVAVDRLALEYGERSRIVFKKCRDEEGTYVIREVLEEERWYPKNGAPPTIVHKGLGYRPLPEPEKVAAAAPASGESPLVGTVLMGAIVSRLTAAPRSKKRAAVKQQTKAAAAAGGRP